MAPAFIFLSSPLLFSFLSLSSLSLSPPPTSPSLSVSSFSLLLSLLSLSASLSPPLSLSFSLSLSPLSLLLQSQSLGIEGNDVKTDQFSGMVPEPWLVAICTWHSEVTQKGVVTFTWGNFIKGVMSELMMAKG